MFIKTPPGTAGSCGPCTGTTPPPSPPKKNIYIYKQNKGPGGTLSPGAPSPGAAPRFPAPPACGACRWASGRGGQRPPSSPHRPPAGRSSTGGWGGCPLREPNPVGSMRCGGDTHRLPDHGGGGKPGIALCIAITGRRGGHRRQPPSLHPPPGEPGTLPGTAAGGARGERGERGGRRSPP